MPARGAARARRRRSCCCWRLRARCAARPATSATRNGRCAARRGRRSGRGSGFHPQRCGRGAAHGRPPSAATGPRTARLAPGPGRGETAYLDRPLAGSARRLERARHAAGSGTHAGESRSATAPWRGLVEPLTSGSLRCCGCWRKAPRRRDRRATVLALNTVKRHISNIFEKLGTSSRTRAVAEAAPSACWTQSCGDCPARTLTAVPRAGPPVRYAGR